MGLFAMPEGLVSDKDTIFLGCDPGIHGGLAAVNWEGDLLDVIHLPQKSGKAIYEEYPYAFKEMARFEGPKIMLIEKVGARRGNSATSMFSFGFNTGICYGLSYHHHFRVEEAPPQEWMKLMHGDHWFNDKLGPKQRSIAAAKDLLPDEIYWRSPTKKRTPGRFWKSRSVHDGKVEAYLIAEYNRLKQRGLFNDYD